MANEGEDITQRYYQSISESSVHEIIEEVGSHESETDTLDELELQLQNQGDVERAECSGHRSRLKERF